ncbi:MAG: LruC domain-containing protein [Parabacteroides sp.]|nr:LruC domain-containing protein [Parabacteroides sp.]
MKRRVFTKVKFFALFLFAVLMAACTADVYEPKPDPTPDPEKPEEKNPVSDIVSSISKKKTLDVNVADAYDGKYYYTVEVFTENPTIVPTAKMLPGSGQKTNSKLPYRVELSFPETMTIAYIRVTDPFERAAVYAFDIVEGESMVCNIGGTATTPTKSGAAQLRSVSADFPEIDYKIGSDYETLSGNKKVTLRTGKTYLIPSGSTLSGSVSLPGEGNVKIYVAGTWNIVDNTLQMEKGTSVFILGNGVVDRTKGNGKISMIGSSMIAVQDGGRFGSEKNNDNINLDMTNYSSIINEGSVELKGVKMDSFASIYNKGEFDIDDLTTSNMTCRIVNMKEMEVKKVHMNNGQLDNFCKFESEDFVVRGMINNAPSAYMDVKHLTAAGLTLFMDAKSMWEGEKATFSGESSNIKGSDTDYALFKVKNIDAKGFKSLNYQKKINVECKKHVVNTDPYTPVFTQDSEVAFSDGQGFVEIDEDSCNNGGNHNPGVGPGDTDESYEEVETLPYTYLFEDGWPSDGDYDMNDLVVGVEILNSKVGAKTASATVKYILYATGATRQIGLGFQLDNISASAVSGSEAGQAKAVFQLFTDAHSLLGSSSRTPINTHKILVTPAERSELIQFNTPIDGVVNANNLNLFIVTNDFDSDRRNEVHVAGFKGTDKAALDSRSSADYVSKDTGLMWALYVPSADFATYPKENVRIDDAYEGFGQWIKGVDMPDWYQNYVEDKVVKYEYPLSEPEE